MICVVCVYVVVVGCILRYVGRSCSGGGCYVLIVVVVFLICSVFVIRSLFFCLRILRSMFVILGCFCC